MCMLLCERDEEISRSVVKALRNHGVPDIHIANNAETASHLIDLHEVAVAVVDFAAEGELHAAELVRSLSERGAEVILYSHRQPEPAEFADLHYIFVDKSVDVDALAHVAASQRRLAYRSRA